MQRSNLWRGRTDVENAPLFEYQNVTGWTCESTLSACMYTAVSSWTDLQLAPGMLSEETAASQCSRKWGLIHIILTSLWQARNTSSRKSVELVIRKSHTFRSQELETTKRARETISTCWDGLASYKQAHDKSYPVIALYIFQRHDTTCINQSDWNVLQVARS